MTAKTISKAAEAAGVHVETVRDYERRGLIARPKAMGGYRTYPDEIVNRIRFIKRAQALGFSLNECKELLGLRAGRDGVTKAMRSRLERKTEEIDAKLKELRAMRKVLKELTARCPGDGNADRCPILKTLEGTDRP